MAIPLVEVFYSIQGEGFWSGRAAVFIRLAGCNLDCHFADGSICDTPWRKPNLKASVDEILKMINPFQETLPVPPMVVITGGEPTASPGFDDLIEALHEEAWYIAVETNGTRFRRSLRQCHWITVSPKDLPEIWHGEIVDDPKPSPRVMEMANEVRYVISTRHAPVPPLYSHARNYLSPAFYSDGSGMEAQQKITPQFVQGAVERCLEIVKGDPRWRISLQTHKWLQVR